MVSAVTGFGVLAHEIFPFVQCNFLSCILAILAHHRDFHAVFNQMVSPERFKAVDLVLIVRAYTATVLRVTKPFSFRYCGTDQIKQLFPFSHWMHRPSFW